MFGFLRLGWSYLTTSLSTKVIFVAVAMAALALGYGLWHHKVWQEGYEAHVAEIAKAVEEGKKQYEKTSIEVQRLSDDALRRELCKWVRDADMPTCLKTLAPFRP